MPGLGDGVRSPVDAHAAPWSSLARVQVPGLGRCTGVVVGPRLVLTAAHCLFSSLTGHFVPPGSIHVLTGYSEGGFTFHTVVATYRTLPDWRPRAQVFGADAALLTLAEPAPAPVLPIGEASDVALGGYNQDRAEIIEADLHCQVLGPGRDAVGLPVLRHDCAATRGTSGAPLLARQEGRWVIAGLQTGAAPGRGGVAVPTAALRALLAGP